MTPRPFSREGLHRLECECGAYVYVVLANAESHGIPMCACGERFVPARREVALALGVSCPAITEFETAKALGLSDDDATAWVEKRRRAKARERRLAAIGLNHG